VGKRLLRQALEKKDLGTTFNKERLHQSLDYKTPDEAYYRKQVLTMSDRVVVQNFYFLHNKWNTQTP